jgi:hypothetical protein
MRAVDELERAEKLDALVAAQLADPLGNPHRVSAFLLGVLGELARHLSPVDPRRRDRVTGVPHPADDLSGQDFV